MASRLIEIFKDEKLIKKIQERLPYMFELANLECSRNGNVGMEVGTKREYILVALLIHKFGEENVNTKVPITKKEIDAILFDRPISVKSITSSKSDLTKRGGVKLIWTADAAKGRAFIDEYIPQYDLLFAHIIWNGVGGLYGVTAEAQIKLFNEIGKHRYTHQHREGTNSRGVEISGEALGRLCSETPHKIPIAWQKGGIEFNQYGRWVDIWNSKELSFA